MGVAGYQRGSALISRQADEQVADSRKGVENRDLRAKLRDLQLQLTKEREKHDAQMAKAQLYLKAARTEAKYYRDLARERQGQRNSLYVRLENLGVKIPWFWYAE